MSRRGTAGARWQDMRKYIEQKIVSERGGDREDQIDDAIVRLLMAGIGMTPDSVYRWLEMFGYGVDRDFVLARLDWLDRHDFIYPSQLGYWFVTGDD
jgi:hypothetical protein